VPDKSPRARAGRSARNRPKPAGKARPRSVDAEESAAVTGWLHEEAGAPAGDDGSPYEGAGASAGEEGPGGTTGEHGQGRQGRAGAAGEPGGEEAARAICLRLLTNRPRTRAELATALQRRRIPDDVAESVLGRFAEVGLIDDAAFARAWVESRHHSRGLARRALAAELRQRGISDGEVRSAVSLLGPQDEIAAARRLVDKRAAASRGQPWPARARQLMGMLARKGYSADVAAQVVREALDRERADGSGGGGDLAWIWQELAGDEWP